MKAEKTSLLQMARGAIQERVDYELSKVIDNILDVNTDPKAKRKIAVSIELKPHEDRMSVNMVVKVDSKLAPTVPIESSFAITGDKNGEMIVAEYVPQVPGQMSVDGPEQEEPKILKIAQQG